MMCQMFVDSPDLDIDTITTIKGLCNGLTSMYTIHRGLNISFGVIMLIGLGFAVFMYKQNKKEYDKMKDRKRRKQYYISMRQKLANRIDEGRQI